MTSKNYTTQTLQPIAPIENNAKIDQLIKEIQYKKDNNIPLVIYYKHDTDSTRTFYDDEGYLNNLPWRYHRRRIMIINIQIFNIITIVIIGIIFIDIINRMNIFFHVIVLIIISGAFIQYLWKNMYLKDKIFNCTQLQ